MKDFRMLRPDDIEVRIQSVNKGGARLLLYKNARVDMNILDETFGPMNWQRKHCRDNQNCIVSIWDDEKKQWIDKEDTGTESDTEREKGLASDSFKRACFNWGIGRELYTAPDMFVYRSDLDSYEASGTKYKCFDHFKVKDIQYDGRNITKVVVLNENNGKTLTFKNKTLDKPEPVSQANIEVLKRTVTNKGLDLEKVLEMAGVRSIEGITADQYNRVVSVVRGLV